MQSLPRPSRPGRPRCEASKAELVLDACLDELDRNTLYGADQSVSEIITDQVRRLIDVYESPVGRMVGQLLAEGQYEPSVAQRFFQDHIEPRRRDLARLIGGDPDQREFLLDLIYGPIYFRLLVGHKPMDKAFADRLVAETTRQLAAWQK